MPDLEVVGLTYYPIKSCAGTDVDMVGVTPTGFEHDRELMLVDDNGVFQSQRKNPELALVYPEVIGRLMTINAPGQEPFTLFDLGERDQGEVVEASVHGKPVSGQNEGPKVAEWFSEYLKKDVKLIRVQPDLPRFITERYRLGETSNMVGFADAFAISIATRASLDAFNSLLDEPVPMNRFRPNIVVDSSEGLATPYDEDYWRKIYVGEMAAYVVRACARCETTDTNQVDGSRSRVVRTALTRNRRGIDLTDPDRSKGMFFMQNLSHEFRPGMVLRVGDEVTVEERSDKPNFEPINK